MATEGMSTSARARREKAIVVELRDTEVEQLSVEGKLWPTETETSRFDCLPNRRMSCEDLLAEVQVKQDLFKPNNLSATTCVHVVALAYLLKSLRLKIQHCNYCRSTASYPRA